MELCSSPRPTPAPGSTWPSQYNASLSGERWQAITSMMWRFSRTGFVTPLLAGTDIPLPSSGEANATLAVIGPTLVAIALVAQEPRHVTFSHSAFVRFATTGELPNAAGLGN